MHGVKLNILLAVIITSVSARKHIYLCVQKKTVNLRHTYLLRDIIYTKFVLIKAIAGSSCDSHLQSSFFLHNPTATCDARILVYLNYQCCSPSELEMQCCGSAM